MALGITFLMYLGVAALSFIDKRSLFMYPEDKPRIHIEWRNRWKAFLGKNIEGTIYEKENKLFKSIGYFKEPESPVDLFLFLALIITVIDILITQSVFIINQLSYLFWLILISLTIFIMAKRKAL